MCGRVSQTVMLTGALDTCMHCVRSLRSIPAVQHAALVLAAAVVVEPTCAMDAWANGGVLLAWLALRDLATHTPLQAAAWGFFANFFAVTALRQKVRPPLCVHANGETAPGGGLVVDWWCIS
jgi:hypothetical protein